MVPKSLYMTSATTSADPDGAPGTENREKEGTLGPGEEQPYRMDTFYHTAAVVKDYPHEVNCTTSCVRSVIYIAWIFSLLLFIFIC